MMPAERESVSLRVVTTVGEPARSPVAIVTGLALLALSGAASWAANRQLDRFLAQLDADALHTAKGVLDRAVEQQRSHVLSQVGVLAEDTRIRATMMMPNPDATTVQDVLQDLMATSGAGLLAVLDVGGKVRAVTGIEGLREIDLGSSTVVKKALERPAAYIWTFPRQVLAIGVAPIRSHGQVHAFLVMGFEAARPALAAIESALGVAGAVVIGDKVAASSTDDRAMLQAFRTASNNEEDQDLLARSGDRSFLSRVTRVTDSAAAAKIVWMVPRNLHAERVKPLALALWTPSVAAALMFALILFRSRRADGKAS